MNYWLQNGFPSKMVLVMFTRRGTRYYHARSLWVDFEAGVIIATQSSSSRYDFHDPGNLAFDDTGSTVVDYWEAKLKGERPRWIDNGQLKYDVEIPVDVLKCVAKTVTFPKGTAVRYLNQLKMDAMTGRIIGQKPLANVLGYFPDFYGIGEETFQKVRNNLPKCDRWLNFEGGQWEVYSLDTHKIPDGPKWPDDARTREGRAQKAALDAYHKDYEWMRKLGLQNHLWDACKYGASSCVAYKVRSHTIEYSSGGTQLPSPALIDQTPYANRRTRQEVLKYWLRKAHQGVAEVPDELFARHKKRHETVGWLRRQLFNEMPGEKARMVKAIRRYAAKFRLPQAQTTRLLQLLAAGGVMGKV